MVQRFEFKIRIPICSKTFDMEHHKQPKRLASRHLLVYSDSRETQG